MKRAFVIYSLLLLSFSTFISCRETQEKETIIREKEVEREVEKEQEEEPKGILERTGEKVDQEVNEEIDKEVEKIGD